MVSRTEVGKQVLQGLASAIIPQSMQRSGSSKTCEAEAQLLWARRAHQARQLDNGYASPFLSRLGELDRQADQRREEERTVEATDMVTAWLVASRQTGKEIK